MTIPELGNLEQVDLRQAWPHEARSFTPWLSENIEMLSSVIGIPLELEGQEVAVEQFSADILARNPRDDSRVLIENQLEQSDHGHIGQIMTYLAGLDVNTVIWIAAGFREPHLSAIRWLNDHTIEPFAFFAIKLSIVRIADSPMAPVFEVVVKPNTWERQLQSIAKETQSSSGVGEVRKKFWTYYLEKYPEEGQYGPANGSSNRWRPVIEAELVVSSYISKGSVGLFVRGLRGVDQKEVWNQIEPFTEELIRKTGGSITSDGSFHDFWRIDTSNESNWDEMADWLYQKSRTYENALSGMGQESVN
ncbi:TPA: hypothetical protein EYM26_11965 [Candidatus Poribacteria bacterium]|nr:hypothetical protein [Candidatus Poribacteria bacterium]